MLACFIRTKINTTKSSFYFFFCFKNPEFLAMQVAHLDLALITLFVIITFFKSTFFVFLYHLKQHVFIFIMWEIIFGQFY